MYLNTNKALENYKELFEEKYFVDKSEIIHKLNDRIGTRSKYVCITRPRRFGKSSVADMLGAYYGKALNAKEIFDQLKISELPGYEKHINKYNIINISFNRIPDQNKSYDEYIGLIRSTLIDDLKSAYPDMALKSYFNVSDMLYATNDKFIFIFDEWDYIFTNNLFVEHQNEFLEFLRNLLKDQPYVILAYMTGVLPIKRYASGSALNMFDEFTMLNDMLYGDYFGFTEDEVKELCSRQSRLSFEELKEWYNGYSSEEGTRLYNPRSVVKALQSQKCKSFWTSTGAMHEILQYLKYNILEVRDDVIKMVAGEPIRMLIDEEFRAGQEAPRSKEEIYSAMIILGFLAYHEGTLQIPNKEVMREFEKALKDQTFGYVSQILKSSETMLNATLNGDEKTVEAMRILLFILEKKEIQLLL